MNKKNKFFLRRHLAIALLVVFFAIMPMTSFANEDTTLLNETDSGELEYEALEFEVSESAYENIYKNDPNYELIDKKTYYRYSTRTKQTTTDGHDTLTGWTKYDTKTSSTTSGYKFGTPISTSTSYANGKKTVKSAINKGYYYYAYSVASPFDTSDWAYYVAKSRSTVISHMQENFSASSAWAESRLRYFWYISSSDLGTMTGILNKTIPYCADSTVNVGTTTQTGTHLYDLKLYKYNQCYKVKTTETVNYFYQWSAWSAWGDWTTTKKSISSDTGKEESETRYLIKLVKQTKSIENCVINMIGDSSFEYDGSEKYIDFDVCDGENILEEGTDYYVEGNRGIDAGKYDVKIFGMGDYAGELGTTFEITKADSVIDFDSQIITKSLGTEDFINEVYIVSDGDITYKSSNENVATVNQEGIVSILGKGTSKIIVSISEGVNYKACEKQYEVIVSNNLFDCDIDVIGKTIFTYDGTEKKLALKLYDGEYELIEGTDYIITNNGATNVGDYSVTIKGIGDYIGELEKAFSITKASTLIKVESNSITKKVTDEDFSNPLSIVTDGSVNYKSSNEKIATVSSNGTVHLVAPGNVIITVYTTGGKNYKDGSINYSITVTDVPKELNIDDFTYNFMNNREGFGYSDDFIIPAACYRMIFGRVVGNSFYAANKGTRWGGNCNGISTSTALLYDKDNDIHVKSFNSLAKLPKDLYLNDTTSGNISLTAFIEALQVSQNSTEFQVADQNNMVSTVQLEKHTKNLNSLVRLISEQTNAGVPVLVTLRCKGIGGHAVLAYSVKLKENSGSIYIYDSNHPGEECEISISKDNEGNWASWGYNMGRYGVWGEEDDECLIGAVPYGIIKNIWDNRGDIQQNYNLLGTKSKNIEIYDVEDNLVADIENGKLIEGNDGIVVHSMDLSIGENNTETYISMPIDYYTVKNTNKKDEKFSVELLNSETGASITTSAKEVSLVADDNSGLNSVSIDASKDDYYDVTLNSLENGNEKELNVQGKGSNKTLSISQSNGIVNVENCEVLSISSDSSIKTKCITAKAYGHGKITNSGKSDIVKGTDREYEMIPDPGYTIQDVIVDDESVGSVESYTFRNVSDDHEIVVIFEPSENYKRIDNVIHASDITKTQKSIEQVIPMDVLTDGKTNIEYQSNVEKIEIDENGLIKIPANYIGIVGITIIAEGNNYFNQAVKMIELKIQPKTVTNFSLRSKKKHKLKVTWSTVKNASGYRIQYSTSKSFKNAKTKFVKGGSYKTTTIKHLKSKKRYYVRIKAYKKVNDKILYSNWSTVRKLKVR